MHAFFVDGESVSETSNLDEVRKLHADGRMLWIDLGESDKTKDRAAVDELLTGEFNLHPLVLEDIWEDRALPKIEDFEAYLYVLVHGVRMRADKNVHAEIELLEVDIVIGQNWVITHHHGAECIGQVRQSLQRSPKSLKKGPAWVLHGVLDHLVDDYLPVLDALDAQLDKLDEAVIHHAGTPTGHRILSRLLSLKRTLQGLRRICVQQREILLRLSRGEFDEVPQQAMPFFRDVYDHFAHVTDLTDSHRELASNAIESYLSMQSNRMNEVMKTLTMMSTVMLPLTFVAGVYGMNFEHMPELKWHYGYAFAICSMAAVAIAIVLWFRHKKWL
ncbi:magnesium/cobalt transporter CorA [Pendulispora brunnea]|uniref:Magnesium transport protein CorA n=1 Tax=Pendulispora brunnea TaxID=2905690 RepID=A0ABZ2KN74_9BACT